MSTKMCNFKLLFDSYLSWNICHRLDTSSKIRWQLKKFPPSVQRRKVFGNFVMTYVPHMDSVKNLSFPHLYLCRFCFTGRKEFNMYLFWFPLSILSIRKNAESFEWLLILILTVLKAWLKIAMLMHSLDISRTFTMCEAPYKSIHPLIPHSQLK